MAKHFTARTVAIVSLLLSAHVAAEICKYVDTDGNMHFTNAPPERSWKLLTCGVGDEPSPKQKAPSPVAAGVVTGPPTILDVCMDAAEPQRPGVIVGPSLRAAECTRLVCAEPDTKAIIRHYAMRDPQTKEQQKVALICVARAEMDRRTK
jgi:hypothetical protein